MANTKQRSSLHMEKFKRTKNPRTSWDLAKMSGKSITIATELPEDIINLMETHGPLMEAQGLITTNTSYSIMRYCVIVKIIALDMAIRRLDAPDANLTKFLIKRKLIKQPTPRKKMMEYYPGKHTIPVSSAIPNEIAKLAETYGPVLEERKMIPLNTPYNMWKFCVSSVMTELSKQFGGENA